MLPLWYQQNCNIRLYTTQATSASNVSYMWPWSHKGTMRLEQECTDEIEKESMGREKEDPSPQKIHKFSRVFTVLRKFLVNESHELNTVRSQYRKEHFWSIVCCQPIHSEKKKWSKQELVYFWKEQLVHLQKEPRHVPQQRLIIQGCQQKANVPCGPAWRPLWDRTWRWEPGTLVTLTYVTQTGGRVYILAFKKKLKK